MMISEFSTFGSSASRHILNKNFNEGFEENFKLNHSLEEVSLISLMSNPVVFDDEQINSSHDYDNVCVKQDLTKDFLDFLLNDSDVEYLIIDTYNDVELNVIKIADDSYITSSSRLKNVDYYDSIKDSPQINIHKDFDEYFEIWKDACDRFFEFLGENRPDIRVILNMARLCYRYRDNWEIVENKSYKKKSKDNELRDILDFYIIENHDVEILKFSEDTLIDKNHIFGLYPTHYEPAYFKEKNNQLLEIVKRNALYEYNSTVNIKFREIDKKDVTFNREYKKYRVEDI